MKNRKLSENKRLAVAWGTVGAMVIGCLSIAGLKNQDGDSQQPAAARVKEMSSVTVTQQ